MITCPSCGNEDQRQIAGVEIRGVFDGVAIWYCEVCRHMWPRFSEGRVRTAAQDWIKQHGALATRP